MKAWGAVAFVQNFFIRRFKQTVGHFVSGRKKTRIRHLKQRHSSRVYPIWMKTNSTLTFIALFDRVARFFLAHDTKIGKLYRNNRKYTKWSYTIPDVRKIFQMAIKYINIFQSKAL
jgi:hypothetical protein